MDTFAFYQEWLASQFPVDQGASSGREEGFNALRKRFGRNPFWDFLKRSLSFRVKIFIKSFWGDRKLFYYPISAGEKVFAINYVNYICTKKPIIDESLFSEKEDLEEARRFLRKQFYCAHFDRVPWKSIFPDKEYVNFLAANKKNSSYIKKRKDYYEYNGFKTRMYGFEYGVLANRCGLGSVPSAALADISERVVIDCGAFTGDSVYFLKSLRPKKILALEPERTNFKFLKENIVLNDMTSVVPIMMGAGDRSGSVKFSDGGAGGQVIESGSLEIDVDRIDHIMEDFAKDERVGLIKMDIEGYEKMALEGAEQSLKNDKPILVIALYHSGKDFFEIPPYIKRVNPNYQFSLVHTNPLTPLFEEYLIAY